MNTDLERTSAALRSAAGALGLLEYTLTNLTEVDDVSPKQRDANHPVPLAVLLARAGVPVGAGQ